MFDTLPTVDPIAGRWWNGKYGIARRDIWLYQGERGWRVEALQGGERGKPWIRSYSAERDARNMIAEMIERTVRDGWRDLSKTAIEADQLRRQRQREAGAP